MKIILLALLICSNLFGALTAEESKKASCKKGCSLQHKHQLSTEEKKPSPEPRKRALSADEVRVVKCKDGCSLQHKHFYTEIIP